MVTGVVFIHVPVLLDDGGAGSPAARRMRPRAGSAHFGGPRKQEVRQFDNQFALWTMVQSQYRAWIRACGSRRTGNAARFAQRLSRRRASAATSPVPVAYGCQGAVPALDTRAKAGAV